MKPVVIIGAGLSGLACAIHLHRRGIKSVLLEAKSEPQLACQTESDIFAYMPMIVQLCQVIVALGLLNVWLIRFNKQTEYRGGAANSMKEEFKTYGLPEWFCYAMGGLKSLWRLPY